RVHPFVEQVDGLALAGAVDAVHQDHDGKLRALEELVLQLQKARAQPRLLALVLRLLQLVADLGGLEHGPNRTGGRDARAGARAFRALAHRPAPGPRGAGWRKLRTPRVAPRPATGP